MYLSKRLRQSITALVCTLTFASTTHGQQAHSFDAAAGQTATLEREVHAKMNFYADVFNLEAGDDVRARAAETYSKFLRKTHAQDKQLDEHKYAAPPPRRSGDEPPPTQVTQVDKVVDVMMLELEEMEHRRQEAIRKQKSK